MTPVHEEDRRLRLTLLDARRRALLSPNLVHELIDALGEKPRHAWVTLEGPDAFCEGLDLELVADQHDAGEIEAALRDYAALLGAIERHPRPVIALVDGAALGGGVGVAAAADLVLATARASFALPEVLVGLIPAVVLPVLARRIGWSHARSLALGRIPLSADAALRLGLIDEISDDLDRTQRRHASRFARMSPDALAAVKELSAAEFASREEYTREATRRFAELLATPSTRNRLRRFAAGDAPWPEAPDAIDKEKQ